MGTFEDLMKVCKREVGKRKLNGPGRRLRRRGVDLSTARRGRVREKRMVGFSAEFITVGRTNM